MKAKIPVKNLVQSNWVLALTSTVFLSIFLFTYKGTESKTLFVVVRNTIDTLVISFLDILFIILVDKYGGSLSMLKQRLYRYAVTYSIALAYAFLSRNIITFAIGNSLEAITVRQQTINVIAGSLGLTILIFVTHNLVMAYQAKSATESENAALKIANAEATNLLLRQQIHPHFLFNALSILKTLYKKDLNAGDTYIVHLASFLRAAISNTSAKVVKLKDEIKLCDDYIAMQRIRFGGALQYQMAIPEAEYDKDYLPFYSIQPLLENAIKHNEVTDEKPLSIRVFLADDCVVVENNLQPKKQLVPSTGNGLLNLRQRYQLLSGDELKIQETATTFSVWLKILKA